MAKSHWTVSIRPSRSCPRSWHWKSISANRTTKASWSAGSRRPGAATTASSSIQPPIRIPASPYAMPLRPWGCQPSKCISRISTSASRFASSLMWRESPSDRSLVWGPPGTCWHCVACMITSSQCAKARKGCRHLAGKKPQRAKIHMDLFFFHTDS